jgi:hypothetical protein
MSQTPQPSSALYFAQTQKLAEVVTMSTHKDIPCGSQVSVSDEELLAMKPLKPRKKATFDAPTPSNFCHICSRTPSRGIRLAVCSGLQLGQCRKVVCERCFTDYSLGCTFDDAKATFKDWKCAHCSGICPERAQCRTYQNVNRKLRLQRLRQLVAASPKGKQPGCFLSVDATALPKNLDGTGLKTAPALPAFSKMLIPSDQQPTTNMSLEPVNQVSPNSIAQLSSGSRTRDVIASSAIAALITPHRLMGCSHATFAIGKHLRRMILASGLALQLVGGIVGK